MDQHFILCGLGRVGERMLEHLQSAGARVVVIDTRCAAGDERCAVLSWCAVIAAVKTYWSRPAWPMPAAF